MTDFVGLVAVVTGGASGIGAATARLLQSRGARVAALDPNTDGVPDGVLSLRCDVTDTAAVDEAVATVADRLGALDVLVNNAGIGAVGDVAPGTADTPWVARLLDGADDPEAAAEALRKLQPFGRLVTADEVAYAIASLLAAWTTGTILQVDGGMTSLRL